MSLTAALGLIQFAPKLISLFDSDGSSKVSKIAETVSGIAKKVTGKDSTEDAVEALRASPDLAYQFQIAVMENETVLERLDEQSRQRATDQYKTNSEEADRIAERVTKYNLLVIFLLVAVNIIAVKHFEANGSLVAVVSNLIGVVIGQLLNERQSVISFFFGSSLGSKIKTLSMSPGKK